MEPSPIIVWFRRDLRLADNPALLYAAGEAAPIVPVYVLGWEDRDPWAPGSAGRWWLGKSLEQLAISLAAFGTPLRLVPGSAEEAIPDLCRQVGAGEVVWNRLYEPYSRTVEARVAAALEARGAKTRAFEAALLFEPAGHLAGSGRPLVQFTPFWRSCLSLPEPAAPQSAPRLLTGLLDDASEAPSRESAAASSGGAARRATLSTSAEAVGWLPEPGGWEPAAEAVHWEPGEAGAHARLRRFLAGGLAGYDAARDYPASDGTSRLSPHLHFGEIGPRQVWHAVREVEGAAGAGARQTPAAATAVTTSVAAAFLRQLGWREFGHYLLFHFPDIPDRPFRPEFARFPWEDDPDGLEAWKRGETGYALVDAAMHQLATEGWVHNRARMVAASFLSKDLLVSWQEGAAWFWDRLVDADLANNTLGWQWTAGSGPDAAPYFRVFNPTLQSRRYDPDGNYTRAWNRPADGPGEGPRGAPHPIVDHAEARDRALVAFHSIRKGSAAWPRAGGQP